MGDVTNALAFEHLSEPPGIEVIDRIEQQRYSIHTPESVRETPTSTDEFQFPVGRAIEFETTAFTLLTASVVFVRDCDGQVIAEAHSGDEVSLTEGRYCLELSPQIKTYVEFASSVEVTVDTSSVTVQFGRTTDIRMGVRSRHEHPAGPIKTTTDPADIMAAIEAFGSALKTFDPERSYPTLRGHPPAVELSDELVIPEGLKAPNTGITLELPLNLGALYVAAPLAYYLGASIETGKKPRLVTDEGFTYDLSGPEGYETKVGNSLKQVFFLDCITRTEGIYQIPLDERDQIEPIVNLDFAECYTKSLPEQVAAYLEIPFTAIEDHIPEWPLSTHVAPVPETIEQLPFVVNDLAVVQTGDSPSPTNGTSSFGNRENIATGDALTRSAEHQTSSTKDRFIQPEDTNAVEQAWIGEDIPIGASKLTADAFRNRLDREITDGDIEIAIVLNDDRMNAERDIVDRVYGDRYNLPFDVTVYRDTSVDELRDLLGRQRGFLHYIGHTEPDGFECRDGKLDAATLNDVCIESFLLNACSSYRQGLNLIEAGAIGGIVTLTDIINDEAVSIGESVARFLNAGFPLNASLSIAREESIQGGQYIVVGDGGMSVAQAEGRVPNLLDIEQEKDQFTVSIRTFTTKDAGLGTIYIPYLSSVNSYYLGSGNIGTFTVPRDELVEFLQMEDLPIYLNGELLWTSSISPPDIL